MGKERNHSPALFSMPGIHCVNHYLHAPLLISSQVSHTAKQTEMDVEIVAITLAPVCFPLVNKELQRHC